MREHLEDFVYQLLAFRARSQLRPLDAATLRGLLQRNQLRPAALLALGERPLDVLNLDRGSAAERLEVAALFMGALMRALRGAQEAPGQARLLERVGPVVGTLQREAGYPLLGPPDASEDALLLRLRAAAGLSLHPGAVRRALRGALAPLEALEALEALAPRAAAEPAARRRGMLALPPVLEPQGIGPPLPQAVAGVAAVAGAALVERPALLALERPALSALERPALPAAVLPPLRPALPPVPKLRRPAGVALEAGRAALEAARPALEALSPLPASPWRAPVLAAPALPPLEALPCPLGPGPAPAPEGWLLEAGLGADGQAPRRWRRGAALALGAGGASVGVLVALEGVLLREGGWVALGGGLAAAALGADAALSWWDRRGVAASAAPEGQDEAEASQEAEEAEGP